MTYIDFHTHSRAVPADTIAVVDGLDTWGIHPWHADEACIVPDLSKILAVGECGLDGLYGPPIEVQQQTLRKMVALGEAYGKPLIIHCVKKLDTLLHLSHELKHTMPWMLHGFRGKPQQLHSLLSAGFYISFGFCYNKESLRLCPPKYLMLETDNDARPISLLYRSVADTLGISLPSLCTQMAENYHTFFRKETSSKTKHCRYTQKITQRS